MGVLQRIALCYGLAALLVYYTRLRGVVVFSIVALLGYWALLNYFGSNGDPYSLAHNAVTHFDIWVMGSVHLYMGEGVPFEPEGLLSTLPATVNVLAGYMVGRYIQKNGSSLKSVLLLLLVGALFIFVGFLWDDIFPINKKIWTSSYVLATVGISTCCLSALMYIIEVASFRNWTYFFEVFGKNPLILYVLSGILVRIMSVIFIAGVTSKQWVFESFFVDTFPSKWDSFLFALTFTALIWMIGYVMDKKSIYIKV